jgi:hypothetical protein
MKKSFGFLLVAASLLLASGAQAQGLQVKADVPFSFNVNNKMYEAGSYDIRAISDSNTAVVLQADGTNSGMALPHRCSSAQPAKDTVLVFHRVGDEYFLYQIWVAGSETGREFPTPKRETLLARNGEKSQDVVVAANLTAK